MNRTIKEATIKAFHYPDLESLKAHVLAFVCAFNFAKHLKALRWKTPYQTIVDTWQKNPAIFKADPRHLIPGPYSASIPTGGHQSLNCWPVAWTPCFADWKSRLTACTSFQQT